MTEKTDEIIRYSLNLPKSIRDYFEQIAQNEQRDLSFIIRRILVKEKHEIEEQKRQDNEK